MSNCYGQGIVLVLCVDKVKHIVYFSALEMLTVEGRFQWYARETRGLLPSSLM